jgi:hypothetical protein
MAKKISIILLILALIGVVAWISFHDKKVVVEAPELPIKTTQYFLFTANDANGGVKAVPVDSMVIIQLSKSDFTGPIVVTDVTGKNIETKDDSNDASLVVSFPVQSKEKINVTAKSAGTVPNFTLLIDPTASSTNA